MSGPWAQVTVEPLTDRFLGGFEQLWIQRREDSGLSREAAQRVVLDGRLARAVSRDGVVLFLARADGEAVGYAWVYDQPTSVLLDTPSVAIEEIFVLPSWRRRGVARTLLLSVGAHAQRCGAEHIMSSVPTHSRNANRTFARLGFAPQTTRRVAPTSLLMRRLRGGQASPLENLMLNRRRSLRARGRREDAALSS
ncbi:MAG: GNAT family N-acetyltransferase [Micrococcales bacterium]|nr:GNAT family N-acetyltransferase [Micrococcales bacterium]